MAMTLESRPFSGSTTIEATDDRAAAVKNAELFLGHLPHNKAKAIFKSIRLMSQSEEKKYFGLSDLIRRETDQDRIDRPVKPPSPAVTMRARIRQLHPDILHIYEPNEKESTGPDQSVEKNGKEAEKTDQLTIRELSQLYADDGSLILPMDRFSFTDSALTNFFNFYRRFGHFDQKEGLLALKGLNYKVAADPKRNYFKKFEVMEEDLTDALDITAFYNRKEINSPENFLLYLGVLDYAKSHALTIYHLLTFNERHLDPGENNDPEYLHFKQQATSLMETTIRIYYQTLLGLEYDNQFTPSQMKNLTQSLIGYTRQKTGKDVLGDKYIDNFEDFKKQVHYRPMLHQMDDRFKTPETQHPLLIALGAQEAVSKYPETQQIVGIPSGGTEAAVVMQMLYQILQDKIIDINYIPVSLHSGIKDITQDKIDEYIRTIYGDQFVDQEVILVDDNSPTGSTVMHIADALLSSGARKVNTHIVDFDATRILKRFGPQPNTFNLVDPNGSTLGITQISDKGGYQQPITDREELAGFRIFNNKENSQKNKSQWLGSKE